MRSWLWFFIFWLFSILCIWGGLTVNLSIDWLLILGSGLGELIFFLEEISPWIIWVGIVALMPGLFLLLGLRLYLHSQRGLPGKVPKWWTTMILAGILISFFGGVRPLQNAASSIKSRNELQHLESIIDSDFQILCRSGQESEAVALLERALDHNEVLIKHQGFRGTSCNHGYSYLFVSLYPASSELSRRLSNAPAWALYDHWHDGYDLAQVEKKDGLVPHLRKSQNPLLRGIGHWMARDYEAFEDDMLQCARKGDERVDSLALIAAINSKDHKRALTIVKPILERGVGLGQDREEGPYLIPASQIQAVLEGRSSSSALYAYFTNPRR